MSVIGIEDNGPGIANDSNLFVPFYTTKSGGSGVGLALARQIVEAHAGSVRLMNRKPGWGARAVVTLPVIMPVMPGAWPKPATRSKVFVSGSAIFCRLFALRRLCR